MQYKPKEYWDSRAENYLKPIHYLRSYKKIKIRFIYTPILKHLIKKIIKRIKPSSLLEVGCGPGRLFNLYENIANVSCIDLSPQMLQRAKNVIEKDNIKNIKLFEMSGQNLKFDDNSFDIVLTSNVLIHVPYENIEEVIAELVRVSKKYIICIEYSTNNIDAERKNVDSSKNVKAQFCFLHNYPKLFGEKAKLIQTINLSFFKQKCFIFKKTG